MSPLDRKLLRDLASIRGQALAIGLVIAVGVMLQVMMSGLVTSLQETRRAYYERNRLADVFAPVARAPMGHLARLAAVPGVARAEGRVAGAALVDLPEEPVPVQARAMSLPDHGRVAVNAVYLTAGRLPGADAAHEALLLDGFARARGLRPGDHLTVTMSGARRSLTITGLAQAPDLLYVSAPGEFTPDPSRFAAIWMGRASLAAAFDMDGAFNEALVELARGASEPEVIRQIDALLRPWGGTGAHGRDELVSDRFVSEEINGLVVTSRFIPPLFLAVAGFLLYIVVTRIVQAEREEIGLLKAFGYTGFEVGRHYLKLILVIAVAGAAAGCVLGVLAGRAMIPVYTHFYNFPFLVFQLDPGSFAIGVVSSVAAASAGGLFVLRRILALTPSEAMRPPVPPDFSRAVRLGGPIGRLLDQPTRMLLRGVARQPMRMTALVAGVAGGMALASGMTTIYGSFDRMMDLNFSVIDRSDATVAFTHPLGGKAAFELARLPGVGLVEPVREVPAVLRNGLLTHRGGITGLVEAPQLARAIGADLRPVPMAAEGVVLGKALADILALRPGDMLTVEVREGRRPVLRLPVAGVAETLIGAPAYMRLDALNRSLREPGRISAVRLDVDPTRAEAVYRHLKETPAVAGISVASEARASLQKLMDQGAGSARYVMGVIAFVIAFGIVYNASRIAYTEQVHDLASLRVMGFSNGEAAFVLLGELALITLVALPLGSAAGYGLTYLIAAGFSTELYQIPAQFDPASHGFAALFVIAASVVSGVLVRRDLGKVDLVTALKVRD